MAVSTDPRGTDPRTPLLGEDGKPRRLMTVEEAADLLGVTPRHAWRAVEEGRLAKTKLNRLVRIHPDDLEKYIKECRSEGTA